MNDNRLGELMLLERVATICERESRDWHSDKTGATLHKIGPEDARRVAEVILHSAREHNVPLAYLMAVIRQESAFDEAAINPNGAPGNIEKTDWGLAQLSGRNMVANGITPETALTAEWAVPFIARAYRGLLDWAKKEFPDSDPFWAASCGYNKGRRGAVSIIRLKPLEGEGWVAFFKRSAAGRLHASRVMGHTRGFRDELGLHSP